MIGRKNTRIGVARHRIEDEEIDRIIEEYKRMFNIIITKLEASAIIAERSKGVFWNQNKAKDFLIKLRGL